MKKRNILYSPKVEELKKRKRKTLRNKMIIFCFFFILIFIGLIFLSRWKKINIQNIQISGNKIIETETIKKIVEKDLAGNYLWFFPKTNFVLYPKKYIENELKDNFKRFSNVSVSVDNIKNIDISVSERDGKYLWCGKNIPTSINDTSSYKCYFMDQEGYLFDEAPYFSGNVYFKFYGNDNLNTENPSGSYFLKDKFKEVTAFIDMIKELNLNPNSFYIDENGDGNILLSSDLITSPKIIFNIDSNYEKISENLQAAIKTKSLQDKIKNGFSSLIYIDLRFGNNVYYKFK